MDHFRRLAFSFSAVLLLVLVIWFMSDHQENSTGEEDNPEFKASMDELAAEDMSLTINMFMSQLERDLLRWSSGNIPLEEQQEQLKEEIDEHPHIYGMKLSKNGVNIAEAGEKPDKSFGELTNEKSNGLRLSRPYVKEGTKRMLMGAGEEAEYWMAEVNLTFIEDFVKDTAALADSDGQFFVGNEEMDLSFSEEEAELPYTKKQIEDIGWQIYVQSGEEEPDEPHSKEGEVIANLLPEIEAEEWAEEKGAVVIGQLDSKVIIRAPGRTTEQLLEDLAGDPAVTWLEPNYMYSRQERSEKRGGRARKSVSGNDTGTSSPDDEFYKPYQWNLEQIGADKAWPFSTGDEGVPIAVIDSGADPEHPDLRGRISGGYNAFENNGDYHDEHGHGTHVAGIAGAVTNNSDGIAGLSWNNPLLPVKALDHNAEGSSLSIARGIVWAADNGAKVINLSLGDSHDSELMHDAIRYAYDKDVVLIAASGNDNVHIPMYPAAYEEVLAVAAVTPHRERAFFSNYGDHIDVSAPGEHIPGTYPGSQYVVMSGTSMASPHVAGMAGLIRSVNPDLSNEEVYDIIRSSSDDAGDKGYDPYYGYGIINAERALKKAEEADNS
ncbi:S8 family peptidase [Evansella sp. LMS18]|uniref:S8 family peptidase n=1 Tax=Evansella sp. LMS18 TaxID=2924033 RepID=UPI0020D1D023|nr:S8 family peptidase [Evansella sp. LMS18]UTR09700.1 S8 family peptidase [Evansella sp. LMS18]